MKPDYYIASCSFGKDSLATILLALEHGEPIDEVMFVEVMFDHKRGVSGEVPEHIEWVKAHAIPYLQNHGLKVTVLHSKKDYVGIFNIVRGDKSKERNIGKVNGFLIGGYCQGNSILKMAPIRHHLSVLRKTYNVIQYIGIAADEYSRLKRLAHGEISLLAKYAVKEEEARRMCEKAGLLSPAYAISTRQGCWFCPNARLCTMRRFKKKHPELWAELEKLDNVDNRVSANFKYNKTLTQVNKILDGMDMQLELFPELT